MMLRSFWENRRLLRKNGTHVENAVIEPAESPQSAHTDMIGSLWIESNVIMLNIAR